MKATIDFPIEELIPYGKANAITRTQLWTRLQSMGVSVSDRKIRKSIEEAKRERGACIVNLGEGYFFPTVDEYLELSEYINQEESRAKSIFAGIKGHKAYLEDIQKGRIVDGFN